MVYIKYIYLILDNIKQNKVYFFLDIVCTTFIDYKLLICTCEFVDKKYFFYSRVYSDYNYAEICPFLRDTICAICDFLQIMKNRSFSRSERQLIDTAIRENYEDVNFNVFVQNFNNDTELINQLNPDWNGAVPATFLYDKSGNQRAFLLGKQSFDELKEEIEKIREQP